MDERHKPEESYDPQRYNPVNREWKVIVFLTISALLILGALAAGWMFAYFDRCSSSQLVCPLILSTLFAAMIVICVCIAVVKLISVYSSNLAKETDLLSTLYKEEEKRRIVKRNEEKAKEENDTKKAKQIENIETKK